MFIIRDVQKKDETAVLEMMRDFYASPACLHAVPEQNFKRTLNEAVSGNPSVRILIVEDSGGAAGYAHFVVAWNNEAGGKQIWFDELYFKERARGKGYGTKVFEWIEKSYPDLKRIRLEVTKQNTRAIALYEKLGYANLGYYQMVKDF